MYLTALVAIQRFKKKTQKKKVIEKHKLSRF